MPIKRITMKFLIPVNISGIKSETLSGRRLIPCYISPQEFNIDERKLITETFTKGGYMVEYWGEELPVITARGTTGSGGIEAIEILRAVYRNEQIQMAQVLRERAREAAEAAGTTLQDTSSATASAGIVSALDSLFENGISEIIDGTKSVVEEITSIFEDSVEEDTNPVTFIPSLGAFAVAVDLYMQGFKYRGFFTDFRVTESGESPGIFEYNFTFKVLRRSGVRKNFMPWHRNPYDSSGNPTEASIPIEGPRVDELSYGTDPDTYGSIVTTDGFSTFTGTQNQAEIPDANDVGVSRLKKVQS